LRPHPPRPAGGSANPRQKTFLTHIITHAVKQPFGGSQSPDDARIAAVAKARREAPELAGTYVESTTVVKNAQVEKDEILALTAGVLKAKVVSQGLTVVDWYNK
jgi:hypothetical protein